MDTPTTEYAFNFRQDLTVTDQDGKRSTQLIFTVNTYDPETGKVRAFKNYQDDMDGLTLSTYLYEGSKFGLFQDLPKYHERNYIELDQAAAMANKLRKIKRRLPTESPEGDTYGDHVVRVAKAAGIKYMLNVIGPQSFSHFDDNNYHIMKVDEMAEFVNGQIAKIERQWREDKDQPTLAQE